MYFIFESSVAGITASSEDMGIIVTSTVMPPKSAPIYETISIPGRAEPIIVEKIQRENIKIPVEATIIEENKLRDAYSLLNGKGKLILSNEPDKYYTGIVSDITPSNIALYMGKLSIEFECSPLAYAVSNSPITITQPSIITVSGTIYAQPVYKIYGSGDIVLIVNNTIYPLHISAVDGYITIDCEKLIAYKDNVVQTNKTTGQFPFLEVGENLIEWYGDVSSIEVTKNERWF